MANEIMVLITRSLTYAVSETERLLDRLGMMGVVLTAFMIYSSYRFFLKPLVGSAGSDKARPKKNKGDTE